MSAGRAGRQRRRKRNRTDASLDRGAEPIGAQAAGTQPAIARGFAVATSDTGHQSAGAGFDGSFMQDQQAVLDFEFVAIRRLAVVAKQVMAVHYGYGDL